MSFAVPPGLHGVAQVYLRRLARELSDDDWPEWTKDPVEPGVRYIVVLARLDRGTLVGHTGTSGGQRGQA